MGSFGAGADTTVCQIIKFGASINEIPLLNLVPNLTSGFRLWTLRLREVSTAALAIEGEVYDNQARDGHAVFDRRESCNFVSIFGLFHRRVAYPKLTWSLITFLKVYSIIIKYDFGT